MIGAGIPRQGNRGAEELNFFSRSASSILVRPLDRGTVLVIVLWIIFAISLLALSFSASIRVEVNSARNNIERMQGYYLSRAGIEYAVYKILEALAARAQARNLQPGAEREVPEVMTGSITLELPDGGARVAVLDESGKINVNLAPEHLLFNLLLMVGLDEAHANTITDSIIDWRDPDEFPRPSGAENEYYQTLPQPYFCKNGLLDIPEELLLIQGITPEIYYGRKALNEAGQPIELYGLQKYLTTFSAVNRININSAPLAVLAAIPGIDYSTAILIKSAGYIEDPTRIAEQIPGLPTDVLGYLTTASSNVYTLDSYGQAFGSPVVSRIRAVIRVDGSSQKGYAVLYWNESNTEF